MWCAIIKTHRTPEWLVLKAINRQSQLQPCCRSARVAEIGQRWHHGWMAKRPDVPVSATVDPSSITQAPEKTVTFHGMCRENDGWSLYKLQIPVSWLGEAERMRSSDSLASVLQFARHDCIREAQG